MIVRLVVLFIKRYVKWYLNIYFIRLCKESENKSSLNWLILSLFVWKNIYLVGW